MKLGFKYFESSVFSRFILLPFALLSISFPLIYSHPLKNQSNTISMQNLKAAFIYNFTKYVSWSNNDTSHTFNISIIGESDIAFPLEEIAQKRKVGDREIKIYRPKDINSIPQSHILFISSSESDSLSHILSVINQSNTLTVSDSDGFAKMGVGINFIFKNGKIGFELNQKAIDRVGLSVSSQLKKLAILVNEVGF